MKNSGIVRKLDELGRIVLPAEIRKVMDIKVKDSVEIIPEGDKIIIKKYGDACVFCGNDKNLTEYMGKYICEKCKNKI